MDRRVRAKAAREHQTIGAGNILTASGNRDDAGVGLRLAQRRDQFEAVAVGHHHVGDYDVEALAFEQMERVLAAVCAGDNVAAAAEPFGK